MLKQENESPPDTFSIGQAPRKSLQVLGAFLGLKPANQNRRVFISSEG